MKLEDHYHPELHEAAILERANGSAANELRKRWTPLVNMKAVVDECFSAFSTSPPDFLDWGGMQVRTEHEAFTESFVKVRNKVCEIAGARALAKPETESYSRNQLVDPALTNIKGLNGVVPLPLKLLLDKKASP